MTGEDEVVHPVDDPFNRYRNIDFEKFERTSLDSMENPTGRIYTRVSSKEQANDGKSISSQKEDLLNICKAKNISLIDDPVVDAGFSGADFARPGIRDIVESARDPECDFVIISQIDRLGRAALKTINFIMKLKEQWDVLLFIENFGEVNMGSPTHQIHVIMQALRAQLSNESRTQRVQRGVIQSFNSKNWFAVYDYPPFGYTATKDNWLTKDVSKIHHVPKIFGSFISADVNRAYTETVEKHPRLDLSPSEVKKIVTNEIYLGYAIAVIRKTSGAENKLFKESIYDESLKEISDSIYNSAQEKIKKIERKYTSGPEETGVEKFQNTHWSIAALDIVPELTLLCSDCDNPMVKNGGSQNPDRPDHYYICQECGNQRLFPRVGELEAIQSDLPGFESLD